MGQLAVEVIDALLIETTHRGLLSGEEVQNMLLDVRNVISPPPKEESEPCPDDKSS